MTDSCYSAAAIRMSDWQVGRMTPHGRNRPLTDGSKVVGMGRPKVPVEIWQVAGWRSPKKTGGRANSGCLGCAGHFPFPDFMIAEGAHQVNCAHGS